MKTYSYAEIAKILGTTKNVIKYRSKKIPAEYITTEDGIIRVNEEGMKWFKKELKEKPVNQTKPVSKTVSEGSGAVSGNDELMNKLVSSLNDRIASLESQLVMKDKQIEELTTSLKAEQTINIQNVGLLKQKEETILKLEADNSKPWFSRIFHKKK